MVAMGVPGRANPERTFVMRRPSLPAVLLCLAAGAACSDDASAPPAGGHYLATVVPPAGNTDGAALIELVGTGIDTVRAVAGEVFTQRYAEGMRVVVVRDSPGTIQFALELAPGSRTPRASIVEVSDGNDAVRTSLTGYRVRFGR